MNIYISMKSIGKRKNVISKQGVQLLSTPGSLRVLLSELITLNVQQLTEKDEEINLVNYLTETEINHQAFNGRVGFGTIYNKSKPDLTEAIQAAIQAFEDGLFLVFVNSEQVEALDIPLEMADGDEVVFIRLTMLAGRMW
jgi:hypothetical protein